MKEFENIKEGERGKKRRGEKRRKEEEREEKLRLWSKISEDTR